MQKNQKEEKAACSCDKDCKCGCQEGKECTCASGCHCCCAKSCWAKLLILIIVFLAGVGFNELLHGGCMGRCPMKNRHSPMMKVPPVPFNAHNMASDDGKTVIIINTNDASVSKKHHDGHMKKHKFERFAFPKDTAPAAENPVTPEN